MEFDDAGTCLRRGCECKCSQCQLWIDLRNKELEAFSHVDTLMRGGKSLFQICELLGSGHPDFPVYDHSSIETVHVDFEIEAVAVFASDDDDDAPRLRHPLEDSDGEQTQDRDIVFLMWWRTTIFPSLMVCPCLQGRCRSVCRGTMACQLC